MNIPDRPGLGLTEWFLIGHEEARLTYNRLSASNPAARQSFHTMLMDILDNTWINLSLYPNRFHNLGVEAATEDAGYWWGMDLSVVSGLKPQLIPQPSIVPLPNYLGCPTTPRDYGQLAGTRSDPATWVCGYCRRPFVNGWLFQDMLQDHCFCSLEHGYSHRHKLFDLVPRLQGFYTQPRFLPLPHQEDKLWYYVGLLPDILSPHVSHDPVDLEIEVPYRIQKGVLDVAQQETHFTPQETETF